MPLRNKPSFMSIARLEIPFSAPIEVLHAPGLSKKKSGTAGPGTLAVDWKATPRRQKYLAPTWDGPPHHRANLALPIQAGLQLRLFEVADHLSEQGTSHLRSSWRCSLRHRLLHDRRNNTSDKHPRHVADRQDSALHRAAEPERREYRASPRIEFLAPMH